MDGRDISDKDLFDPPDGFRPERPTRSNCRRCNVCMIKTHEGSKIDNMLLVPRDGATTIWIRSNKHDASHPRKTSVYHPGARHRPCLLSHFRCLLKRRRSCSMSCIKFCLRRPSLPASFGCPLTKSLVWIKLERWASRLAALSDYSGLCKCLQISPSADHRCRFALDPPTNWG